MKNEQLIRDLVADLKPVEPVAPLWRRMILWAVAAAGISAIELTVVAAIRPEAFPMLLQHPRFMLETLLIFLTPIFAALGALMMSIPGNDRARWFQALALIAFLSFIGLTVYGLWDPIYDATVFGHRDSCPIDISLFGLVPMALLFILVRQAAPLNWKGLSLLITLAAFAPLAAVMQLTCMANSLHNLVGHILPIFVMGLIVLFLGRRYLK